MEATRSLGWFFCNFTPDLPHLYASSSPVKDSRAWFSLFIVEHQPSPGGVSAINGYRITGAGAGWFFLDSFLSL